MRDPKYKELCPHGPGMDHDGGGKFREKKIIKSSGPSCSKLTMSLVNDSLKFQMAILQIHCYFLLKKCENPLQCKGFSHFMNKK